MKMKNSTKILYTKIDLCIDCKLCEIACADRHGISRRIRHGVEIDNVRLPVNCLECDSKACIDICSFDALKYDDNTKFTDLETELCGGCGKCVVACPYDNIRVVHVKDIVKLAEKSRKKNNKELVKYKAKRVAIKCDFCEGYEDRACVTACPTASMSEKVIDLKAENSSITTTPVFEFDFSSDKKYTRYTYFSFITILLSLISGAYFYDYFILDITERPLHKFHLLFKPGGFTGHTIGIVSTILFFINFFYIYVRRFKKFDEFNIRKTLKIHMIAGIIGFIFITYHTAFKFNPNSLAFYLFLSVVVAVVTGIIGRYIYPELTSMFYNEDEDIETTIATGKKKNKKKEKKVRYNTLRKVLKQWHIIHITATIIMVILLATHIYISIITGYNYINLF